ncbi:MAG: L,D-transpeptidase family protein [Gammaproteobacteria bacterium]
MRTLITFFLVCLANVAFAGDSTWLSVDTAAATLTVMQAGQPTQRYENISIGRNGTSTSKRRRDNRTPLGEYRVTHITRNSEFGIFIGIDYPNLRDAERGLKSGLIDQGTYRAIRRAIRAGRRPPQETALGGYIGIHGIGRGDPGVHDAFNWTNGCIALTNEQMADLAARVEPGMRVVIH